MTVIAGFFVVVDDAVGLNVDVVVTGFSVETLATVVVDDSPSSPTMPSSQSSSFLLSLLNGGKLILSGFFLNSLLVTRSPCGSRFIDQN